MATKTKAKATDAALMEKEKASAEMFRQMDTVDIETVPIDSIHPNSYNPNTQTPTQFDLLQKSMQADGFTVPILVQKDSRTIVDGEHRWRAAQSLGYTEVPVVWSDMSIEQMYISTLRHNRARGNEDAALAGQVIRDLAESMDLSSLASELNVSLEELELEVEMDLPFITTEDLVEGLDTAKDNGTTAAVSDLLRQKEVEISKTIKEEEGRTIAKESNYYFVSLTLTIAEGTMVTRALQFYGDTKPEAIVAMCRQCIVEQWLEPA